MRGRNIHEEEIDEAAVATSIQMPTAPAGESTAVVTTPAFANPTALDAVWGNAEWGGAWGGSEANDKVGAGAYRTNGAEGGDPWRSSW
jgi:hypothetical protein